MKTSGKSIDYYITFVFIIKLLYALSASIAFYLSYTKKDNGEFYEDLVFWRDRFEFMFVACMSTLILFFFYPKSTKPMDFDFETKLLFYVYGWIVLLKANWKMFFGESFLLNALQKSL